MELKLLHFYPDLMSLYGSYANVSILKRTLEAMGNTVAVERVRPGEDANIADVDFIYMGAGTERAQKAALADFARYGAAVKAAAENGTAMLFAGNSMELLGASITDDAGKVYAGIGLADFTAAQGKKRFVEDVYGHTALFEDAVVGFVNRCSVLTGVKTPLLTDMELGCGNDYENEKEDFEVDEADTVELINGERMPWEQVKRDGIDYIALYYVNEKGQQVQILDAELA